MYTVVQCRNHQLGIWKNLFHEDWSETLKKPFLTVSAFSKLQALQRNKNIYSNRGSGERFCLLIRQIDEYEHSTL